MTNTPGFQEQIDELAKQVGECAQMILTLSNQQRQLANLVLEIMNVVLCRVEMSETAAGRIGKARLKMHENEIHQQTESS